MITKSTSKSNLIKLSPLKRVDIKFPQIDVNLNREEESLRIKLKAYNYKNECLEALRGGKVYANVDDMFADIKNW